MSYLPGIHIYKLHCHVVKFIEIKIITSIKRLIYIQYYIYVFVGKGNCRKKLYYLLSQKDS